MTSKLQPMDHGIMKNVKIHYRRRILRKTLVSLEDDDGPCPITLWDAISNISKAWDNDLLQATIKNALQRLASKKYVKQY